MSESTSDTANGGWTVYVRRVFVVAWVMLGIAGALDHTIAERVFGERFDLLLPQLKCGYVMFNKNPHTATVYEYTRAGAPDGVRHPLHELVRTPAYGYAAARLAINVTAEPMYLKEVCYRATHGSNDRYTFFVDEYDIDANTRRPARSLTMTCDAHGLVAK